MDSKVPLKSMQWAGYPDLHLTNQPVSHHPCSKNKKKLVKNHLKGRINLTFMSLEVHFCSYNCGSHQMSSTSSCYASQQRREDENLFERTEKGKIYAFSNVYSNEKTKIFNVDPVDE